MWDSVESASEIDTYDRLSKSIIDRQGAVIQWVQWIGRCGTFSHETMLVPRNEPFRQKIATEFCRDQSFH